MIEIVADVLSRAISGYASILEMAFKQFSMELAKTNLLGTQIKISVKKPVYWAKGKLDRFKKRRFTKKVEKEYAKYGDVYKSLILDDKTVVKLYVEEIKKQKFEYNPKKSKKIIRSYDQRK
ncbi:MAG: hypothetical protein ACTSRZ_15635 [Promethearchaeota archaeon]